MDKNNRQPYRHRTSSFFDLAEYNSQRFEDHAQNKLRGNFIVSHSETPDYHHGIEDAKVSHYGNGSKHHQQKVMVRRQNTFQLDPNRRFDASLVESILSEELDRLRSVVYSADMARRESVVLSDGIKAKIKDLFPRYKFIVQVTIGESAHQGIEVASKFFWDKDRDNFASKTVTNYSLFAVAIVYGLYYE
eukprot:gene7726-8565_t